MKDILDAYREALIREDKSPITITNYINDIRLFGQWITETYGEEFNPARTVQREVIEYRSYLATVKLASGATINRKLASLTKFYGWCVATKRTKVNPAAEVKGITLVDPGPQSLDEKYLRRLLREVHVHGNKKHIAILETLCHTGIRAMELCMLTCTDTAISERKGSIRVRSGKGRSSREIPLNADSRKALIDWLAIRPASEHDYLFGSQKGGRLTPSGLWRIVRKYGEFAGIPDIRVHQLRHTCLTRLVREYGTDLVTVAKISGHRQLQTLMRYAAPNSDDLSKAVEKLALAGDY